MRVVIDGVVGLCFSENWCLEFIVIIGMSSTREGSYLDHEVYEDLDSSHELALVGNDGDHSIR